MAKRNRRRGSGGFITVIPWAAALAAGVVLLLAYLWLDERGQTLGVRIRRLECQRNDLDKRFDIEWSKWEALKAPSNIEEALARHQIALTWPAETNLVRLRDPDWVFGRSRPADAWAQASARQGQAVHD